MSVQSGSHDAVAKPRLLFFYRANDGAARRLEGYLAQVLQRRKNHDTFVIHRVEVAQRPDLAQRFKVAETPAFVVVSERQVQARLERPRSAMDIQGLLTPWLR